MLAKSGNILLQFLIEAVALSAVGGVIGVTLGAGLSLLLRYGAHLPAVLSVFWVVTALAMCAGSCSGCIRRGRRRGSIRWRRCGTSDLISERRRRREQRPVA